MIDNKRHDGKTILNIEEERKRKNKGIYFLISSWHNDYYNEKKVLPTQEEIC